MSRSLPEDIVIDKPNSPSDASFQIQPELSPQFQQQLMLETPVQEQDVLNLSIQANLPPAPEEMRPHAL